MDCIELHKLTIFPVNITENQCYYMTQTVKKPQWAMVRQYMARVGVLNDYLTFLPTIFNCSMAVEGTKKGNMPFNEADLARIVLNSVPVFWMNQYNMMHSTRPNGTRTLLQDLESIERVMEERHEAGLKAKAKGASATAIAKGTSKKCSASGNPGEESQIRASPTSSASTARQRAAPISLITPRNVADTTGWAIPWPRPLVSPVMQSSPLKRGQQAVGLLDGYL
jgi:hypothetical protein